jgi:hypothetical protein
MIRRQQQLYNISSLEASLLKNLDFGCRLGAGLCYRELITIAGVSFFFLLPFVLGRCAFIMSLGHFVDVDFGCKWYLKELIFFLYRI